MEESIFLAEDSILFVGEGNFSFSVTFEKHKYDIKSITATCFETDVKSETTLQNIEHLKKAGVAVFIGIDATKLSSYKDILRKDISCIIFNFPHIGGKMKIDRNRKLLKDFFSSSLSLLTSGKIKTRANPRVMVSLCKGQGGTPADGEDLRVWGDSWQIVEMAAASGLVLTKVKPFQHELCSGYSSVGYRSKDIWFHTEKALIHIFEPCSPLLISPLTDESDTLVSVTTSAGILVCERLYIEMAQYTDITPDHFVQDVPENSVLFNLFKSLLSCIENKFESIKYIPHEKIPLHCDNSTSNVPCEIEDVNLSFLRGDLLEVIGSYENFITYGPVFQCVTPDFSLPPVKHQAVICYDKISEILEIVQDWISEQINQDFNIENEENLWTMLLSNKEILAKQRGACIVIELSNIAIAKYKLTGFRDLIKAHIGPENNLQLASIFPRTHTLDICFVEGPEFSEDNFLYTLWRCIGWWVIDVELFDQYQPEGESWRSRGYRIQYRSSKEALSHHAAVTLHQSVLPHILTSAELALKVL